VCLDAVTGAVSTLRLQLHTMLSLITESSENVAPVANATSFWRARRLCDPDGEMLAAAWEPYAVQLANAPSAEVVVQQLQQIESAHAIDSSHEAVVIVAYDTRSSSLSLRDIVVRAVTAYGGKAVDAGLLTTPQLHHIVRARNANESHADEPGYYDKLAQAFRELLPPALRASTDTLLTIDVDCACGVGGMALQRLADRVSPHLKLGAFNLPADGALNDGCGAEHVQKSLTLPRGVAPGECRVECVVAHFIACVVLGRSGCFASLDGDADRIVFYGASPGLVLCDGDKIGKCEHCACVCACDGISASLVARDVVTSLRELGLHDVRVGVVQTAYANGASTLFVREVLKLPVSFVKTGVKHLHHKGSSSNSVFVIRRSRVLRHVS
jgi:phosphoacetylglucosamine mutase